MQFIIDQNIIVWHVILHEYMGDLFLGYIQHSPSNDKRQETDT
jgi:hypothetical protein